MQQRGFTLIELIIVIVILGILAVTAAPKFIDIQSDATESTLNGVKASLQAGSQLVFAKAALQGVQNDENTSDAANVDVDGDGTDETIATFGYPTAVVANLAYFVDLDFATGTTTTDNDWFAEVDSDVLYISPGGKELSDSCYVSYTAPTSSGDAPTVAVESSGC